MTRSLSLLGISGSLRAASTNTLLVREAARLFAPDRFELADIRFPLFDADLQADEGIPAAVEELADQILAADAIIISTPEYNKNLPGGLKNALDWVSRTDGTPWLKKPVAIMSAAAGRAGGERAQFSLRHCMTPFNPRILQGPEVMIANSGKAFDTDGRLIDERSTAFLQILMDDLKALAQTEPVATGLPA
ncbi:NADPH-dependent FMN reductase [Oceanomicrobium pacificus]|uniref:NADPH-dependent FMN reductase n=1 Tax=Oceanomicrobium pacificus TaxID=2692916 RepID=A0A6B0TIA9_9RHOB|nr:NAD(P)H-dependent oxidoreductase [Oceanomicrobium pacificus]MXU64150.1 NADPH-dependent FMN reductase [Oceanomicrobium pacificus]